MPHGKTALITGASSGIGEAAALLFAQHGYTVYGASRRGTIKEAHGIAGKLIPLVMDVTDEKSVREGVLRILSDEGSIDILLYAAGNGISGPAELLTPEDARIQLDVNFYGALRLVNAVAPHMRERRNGLLLFVGSVGGYFAVPYQLLYSASKSALAIYTEGLRLELRPFGVHAAIVEPGDVATGFTDARKPSAAHAAYERHMRRAIGKMEHDERNGMKPAAVARALLKTAQKKNPPARRVVGFSYRVFVFLKRLLPQRLVEALLYSMYLKD